MSAIPFDDHVEARRRSRWNEGSIAPVPPKVPSPLVRAAEYPELRYMGSKHRLLPWIYSILKDIPFETASDPFLGSGCVAYLLKVMGKKVSGSDFLNFPTILAAATLKNNKEHLSELDVDQILGPAPRVARFIEKTFDGVFYTRSDRRFLDRAYANIAKIENSDKRAIAMAALIRSCLKKQPRGVFTVSGDLSHYDDGRRDLALSFEEHFAEQVKAFNGVVFDNGKKHTIRRASVFDLRPRKVDLVYLDPPYVPRADDNCYVKRYHFLEGLSCYWQGYTIMQETKVKKIEKIHSPFGSRKTAIDAFDRMFSLYRNSVIVLSYSSNGYPDLSVLEELMGRYKKNVTIHKRDHRYHFGTHRAVGRSQVEEYLIVGR